MIGVTNPVKNKEFLSPESDRRGIPGIDFVKHMDNFVAELLQAIVSFRAAHSFFAFVVYFEEYLGGCLGLHIDSIDNTNPLATLARPTWTRNRPPGKFTSNIYANLKSRGGYTPQHKELRELRVQIQHNTTQRLITKEIAGKAHRQYYYRLIREVSRTGTSPPMIALPTAVNPPPPPPPSVFNTVLFKLPDYRTGGYFCPVCPGDKTFFIQPLCLYPFSNKACSSVLFLPPVGPDLLQQLQNREPGDPQSHIREKCRARPIAFVPKDSLPNDQWKLDLQKSITDLSAQVNTLQANINQILGPDLPNPNNDGPISKEPLTDDQWKSTMHQMLTNLCAKVINLESELRDLKSQTRAPIDEDTSDTFRFGSTSPPAPPANRPRSQAPISSSEPPSYHSKVDKPENPSPKKRPTPSASQSLPQPPVSKHLLTKVVGRPIPDKTLHEMDDITPSPEDLPSKT
ncbi:hypothetical protein SARC_09138 [Sphaeroforma arctica JP610]|uniref:Uncharacterized protein n=1 Tax=Sphaeroforma arctica JP610 TaxID=667725 RepID=A0A0L0FPJ0_9EUKA|nr:hypothetical protein SARC_09138 [Sphaeroforma arctica JP610]KNC78431.1 hypothetical protein SARC_09138 [Sphaeroforma arctica JP610]|eukprot:XP_014152333.1 hypothetical protein SARC_09138 [Sphaeroforma arctica JP610]